MNDHRLAEAKPERLYRVFVKLADGFQACVHNTHRTFPLREAIAIGRRANRMQEYACCAVSIVPFDAEELRLL